MGELKMYSGEKLGNAIKEAIKLKGIKQAELADFLGVRAPAVSGWIKTGKISRENAQKLIEYFSDVVEPSHFGIESLIFNQQNQNHGLGTQNNVIGTQNNFLSNPSNLKQTIMPDNSFAPHIPQGSKLSYNTNDSVITNGKIYLIKQGEMAFIRRVFRQLSGNLKLVCDNKDFGEDEIAPDTIQIVGRVVSWCVEDH